MPGKVLLSKSEKRFVPISGIWSEIAVFVTGYVPKRCLPGWPRPGCRGRPCDPTSRCPLSPTALQWGGGRYPLWTDGLSTRGGDQTPSPPGALGSVSQVQSLQPRGHSPNTMTQDEQTVGAVLLEAGGGQDEERGQS